MSTLWQDITYAARMLARSPGFTVVAVLTLALGIGANSTIFSWVNAVLLSPLPGVENSNEVYEVTNVTSEGRNVSFSYPNFEDVRDRATLLEGITVHSFLPLNLSRGDEAERVWGALVSGNFFDVLRVKALRGRTFLPEENEVPERDAVLVIGYGLWQKSFGSDPAIVGQTVTVNTHPFTIIGVLPEEFQGPMTALDLSAYAPMMMQPLLQPGGNWLQARGNGWMQSKARLKPGVTQAQAQAELDTIAKQLAEEYPGTNEGRGLAIYPLWNSRSGAQFVFRPVLAALMVVVGLVLLIACANVANLLLARAASRRKEIAIRLSLGAGRWRLIRQLLTESMMLAVLGGMGAVLLAYWSSSLMNLLIPPIQFPVKLETGIDFTVISFTLGLSLVTGLVFGLVPAWQTSRASLVAALNDESARSSGTRTKGRLRSALVIAQVSLSLLLLISAGLFVRSLRQVQVLQPGFNPDGVLLASIDLSPNGYSREAGQSFLRQLLTRLQVQPGVESVALANYVPLNIGGSSDTSFRVDGYEPGPNEQVWAYYNHVTPGYFHTIRNPFVAGRDFDFTDTDDTEDVVIISRQMAEQYWPDRDPLGQKVWFGNNGSTIVGVVEDVKYRQVNEQPVRLMYFPVFQSNRQGLTIHVRTSGDPASLAPVVRKEIAGMDPNLPVFGVQTLRETVGSSAIQQRMAGSMMGAFGLLALALASVGIYGVLAYAVSQRTHEIGIRMALGAGRGDVLKLVLRQGLLLISIGTIIGVAGAFGLTRLTSSLLFGVSPTDPVTYLGAAALLIGVSLLACYFPAWRATKVDPMVALRYE